MRKIKFLETNSEIGAGTRGASLGADALRMVGYNEQNNYLDQYPTEKIKNENQLLFDFNTQPNALRIEGVVKVYDYIAEAVSNTITSGFFPFVLAGDHSSAGGTIGGIKKAYPNKKLGVIWVDAHADLHTPYTSPSGNVHGMPLAASLNEDNIECQRNELTPETKALWNKLKQTAGIEKKIEAEDIVFIALRDFEKEEASLIEKYNIKVITVEEVRKESASQIAQNTLEYLKACDIIYISYDVDCIDDSISKGTGTPVPNGLFEKEIEDLLTTLCQDEKICCFECTEINPILDHQNKMAKTNFPILEKCLQNLVK